MIMLRLIINYNHILEVRWTEMEVKMVKKVITTIYLYNYGGTPTYVCIMNQISIILLLRLCTVIM